MFQHPGDADRFAIRVQEWFARWRTVCRLHSPLLSHIERYRVRAAHRLRVEVHIVSDQKIADTNYGSAGFLVENRWPKIRFPFRLFYFFEKSFVFARSNHSKIRTRLLPGDSFIEIHRDVQFLPDALAQTIRTFDSLFPADIAHRNERANISR